MKTLLITDVPPSRQSSGTLLTWHLCKNFSEPGLVGFFLVSRGLESIKEEFPNDRPIKFKKVIKRYDSSFRPKFLPRKISFLSSFARELYRKYFEVPRYAKDILRFASENKVDKVWIILQGQTMIWLAEYFIRLKVFPVHVQVWDSPNWWIKARGLDRLSSRMIRKSYDFCLENASHFASASFPMSEDYEKKFHKKSPVLIGIIPSSYIVTGEQKRDPKKFKIGIAGQIYATDTFKSLLDALDSIYWELDGRQVEIHYWGNSIIPAKGTRVVNRGYVNQDKLTAELSSVDMLYCPYWFDPSFKDEAQTSFPSKLVTYLASNTMVFFHGPSYSSPIGVLETSGAGICCQSSDIEVIKMNLRKVLYHPNKSEAINSAKYLLEGKLGESFLHDSFKDFMEL